MDILMFCTTMFISFTCSRVKAYRSSLSPLWVQMTEVKPGLPVAALSLASWDPSYLWAVWPDYRSSWVVRGSPDLRRDPTAWLLHLFFLVGTFTQYGKVSVSWQQTLILGAVSSLTSCRLHTSPMLHFLAYDRGPGILFCSCPFTY